MEGVASEAASLAGHLQLGNLIAVCTRVFKCGYLSTDCSLQIYDDNRAQPHPFIR